MNDLDRLTTQIAKDAQRWFGSPSTTDAGQEPPAARRLRTVRLSEVTPGSVPWLWPGCIPLGKLTLLCGHSGVGKSFLTTDLAARASRGLSFPGQREACQPPGTVILFSADDDVADVIRPRLDDAGADVSQVIAVNGVEFASPFCANTVGETSDSDRGFSLETDLPALTDLLAEHPETRLVVIDPIAAYCPPASSTDLEGRSPLALLARTAAAHQVAIIGVTRFPKWGNKAAWRPMESLAFPAAARAVWSVTKDRDDPERRLLLPVKMNLSRDPAGMAYRIKQGRLEWERQRVPMTAEEALAADFVRREWDPTERKEVVPWLRELLAAGALPAGDVSQQALECGITRCALRRAKRALGIKPAKSGFAEGSSWVWSLPSERAAHVRGSGRRGVP